MKPEYFKAVRAVMNKHYPVIFPEDYRKATPLAIGIHKEFLANESLMSDIINHEMLSKLTDDKAMSFAKAKSFVNQFMSSYTKSHYYLLAMSQENAKRVNVSGEVVSDISHEERLLSQKRLIDKMAKKSANKSSVKVVNKND